MIITADLVEVNSEKPPKSVPPVVVVHPRLAKLAGPASPASPAQPVVSKCSLLLEEPKLRFRFRRRFCCRCGPLVYLRHVTRDIIPVGFRKPF